MSWTCMWKTLRDAIPSVKQRSGASLLAGTASLARTSEQDWESVRHSVSRVGPLDEGRYLGFREGA